MKDIFKNAYFNKPYKIRAIYWKQWKKVKTRFKELKKLGVEKELNPDVFICDDLAIIRCCYFNMWKGIVRWRAQYHFESGKIEYVKNSEEYKVLVKYDCGMRI